MNNIKSIEQFNELLRQPTLHPQMTVGDLSLADLSLFAPTYFGMYCVVLMDAEFGSLTKDDKPIQYHSGTMIWFRPGQTAAMDLDYSVKPRGWLLAFRPEFLEKTGLGRDFYMFGFFNHDVNEALTLSESERGIILNSYANIQAEMLSKHDSLSNHMLRLGIGQLLSYCKRFFERQYAERVSQNTGIAERLNLLLDNYLTSGTTSQQGQPTVAWCASQFNLSANYFGEIVKHELHITAQEYIQQKIVGAAQHLLDSTNMTINEIAEELGFAYPTHFTRMFKRKTGLSPQQYRH